MWIETQSSFSNSVLMFQRLKRWLRLRWLSFDYACSSTGINYARHSYVKSVQSDDKDEMYKCYICLFTCATTPNDNLELSSSMNGIEVIKCFKQFLSRRGYVNMLISVNFSSFKSNEVANILRVHDIIWKYACSLFPWRGGFCECLIRILKSVIQEFEKWRSIRASVGGVLVWVAC